MFTLTLALILASNPLMFQSRAKYVFIPSYAPFEGQSLEEVSLLPFKHSQPDIQRTINRVVRAVRSDEISLDNMQERSVAVIAAKVTLKVDEALRASPVRDLSKFEREWMLAEAISEYVRWNVYFDPAADKAADAESSTILARKQPGAVCWGIAVLVRDIARAAGLTCYFVNGNSRWLGTAPPKQSDRNHGVACFVFTANSKQYEVPSDVSIVRGTMQNGKATGGAAGLTWNPPGKVFSQFILPRTPIQWELFFARFNSDLGPWGSISGDDQNTHLKLDMAYAKWSSVDTDYLNAANKSEVNREENLSKGD